MADLADLVDPTDEIERLLRRAGALRRAADALDGSALHALRAQSGPSTWVGPTATWFNEVALSASRAADEARDDLRAAARRLEERADELRTEQAARRAAALAAPHGGS